MQLCNGYQRIQRENYKKSSQQTDAEGSNHIPGKNNNQEITTRRWHKTTTDSKGEIK